MSGNSIASLVVPERLISIEESETHFLLWLNKPATKALLLELLAAQGFRPCSGACSTGAPAPAACDPLNQACTIDTRLSYQRKVNLMRRGGDDFNFSANMPLQPGTSATYTIPPYNLGRVIECFYFRPRMAANGNPDDIKVTIKGEDGVEWKVFRGGRHMSSSNGCCLLECFKDDCLGYDEGFVIILEHTGPQGSPPLLSAAADWNYLYPGSKSAVWHDWKWPVGCGKRC